MPISIVNTSVLRDNLSSVMEEVAGNKDYLLVAKRGHITSALVDIDLFEDLVALSDRGYLQSIQKARQEYEGGDVYTHAQVFGEV